MTGLGLIVDNFAGGGGASLAIEQATGRQVDIAINHDAEALAMHKANHPWARHLQADVFDVDPVQATEGRWVDLCWFSPDCKHFSKAKGGAPVSKRVRGLAWVVLRWASRVRPNVIILENVEEFQTWGPLARDGRPCRRRRGETFGLWVGHLRALGYAVEWRELAACDYGSPTTRKRLFLVARCDGLQITWPASTHGPGRKPYKTAAGVIDWALPVPSIFSRRRPLAEATMHRIARGLQRFVFDAAEPFVVSYYGRDPFRGRSAGEPLATVSTANRHGLVVPFVAKHYGGVTGQAIDRPLPTTTARGTQNQLVAAFLQRHFGSSVGTTTAGGGGKTSLMTSHLLKLRGTCRDGQRVDAPAPTITASGQHLAEVRAYLVKYYSTAVGQRVNEPLDTVTTRDRLGLVTIAGEDYQIVDIGMRMLTPRELFRAQGFPDSYQIDVEHNGKRLTKTAQVRCVGNSVCPQPAAALVEANCGYLRQSAKKRAAR